ncbi:MAG: TcdA/TcdB catalytic glycosyltransferase domain-containing protein, partial [Spiroplasma sp.]
MLVEREEQLKILQEEKQSIISRIKTKHEYDDRSIELSNEIANLSYLNLDVNELSKLEINLQEKENKLFYKIKDEILNDKRIIEIEKEMANLNKLDDSEKNIHAIWIGIPPKGEFDNLKVWAKFNPEYKIHIWTDSNHILSHKLGSIISDHIKKINNGVEEYDYELEAWLKDEFYYNYQLKNPEKTFDENAKQFLLDKKYARETELTNWIKEGQLKIIDEQEDIKKYTNNQVILHDIFKEKDSIFPTKKYDDGYLKTLEHLHICAGASDRLRYAILNKFGGVY